MRLLLHRHPIFQRWRKLGNFYSKVTQFLRALDTSKACGPDGIPPRLLQECAREIAPSICELFNRSLHTGHVPTEWKLANVTPVHKKLRS